MLSAPVAHRTAHRSRRREATCTCGTPDGTQVAAEGGYLHLWHNGRHTGSGGGWLPEPVAHRTAHRSRRREAICTCGTSNGTQVALKEGGYPYLWHIGRHTGRGGGRLSAPVAHRTAHRSQRRGLPRTCGTPDGTQVAAEGGHLHLWHTGRHTGRAEGGYLHLWHNGRHTGRGGGGWMPGQAGLDGEKGNALRRVIGGRQADRASRRGRRWWGTPHFQAWGLGRPQAPRGLFGSTTLLTQSHAPAGRLMPTCPIRASASSGGPGGTPPRCTVGGRQADRASRRGRRWWVAPPGGRPRSGGG